MIYSKLGETGLQVSRICFGSLTIGPLQAKLSVPEGAEVIRYALEQGVNFIDTAKLYKTYPYIRQALRGWDKPVVIASKSYDYTREGMQKSLEEARQGLDRDVVDIFLLHEQESELTLQGHTPALEYLLEAKSRGWVKAVGISTHRVEGVQAATARQELDVVHPLFNRMGLGIQQGTLAEMDEAIRAAHQAGKGIYGMKALGGGNLISQAQEALSFAFAHPALHSVALGCKIKAELDFALAILAGQSPSAQIEASLERTPRTLHIEDWCTGCGACVTKCSGHFLEVEAGKATLMGSGCILCGYCGAVCPEFAIKII